MKLSKRIENSYVIADFFARILAGYLRLCLRTTRWQVTGMDDLLDDLKNGPVILVMWHSRLMLAPPSWPYDVAQFSTLRDPSPAGNLSAATQSRLGAKPVSMSATQTNFSASRQILRLLRSGNSLGMTADGPNGPNQVAKQAAIEWARATGSPIYIFAWSGKPAIRLKTWDRMLIPLPFARGTYIYRRWDSDVPRKLDAQDYERLRSNLGDALDLVMRDADAANGAN